MKSFSFQNPGKLVFGNGSCRKAGKELLGLGARRPILVTDQVLAETRVVGSVKEALGQDLAAVYTGVIPDSGFEIIDQAAALARQAGADSVVSVGGGSSIDTGKAVAAMLASGAASVQELVGFHKLKQRPAPHVAIPTTAGTGSECTSMSVIKDRAQGRKLYLLDPKLIPGVGILDPELTTGLPRQVTAGTGMDALTHAAEAIMSVRAMPPADALALHAISLIAANLPRVMADGADLEARGLMLIAAAEAGQAFQNALVGVVHALSHALGGLFGVPHGLANGMLLWVGMEYNAEAAPERVAMIGKALGAGDDPGAAVAAARDLARGIGLPTRLEDAGVEMARLEEAAALALSDPALATNPRQPADARELLALYRKLG